MNCLFCDETILDLNDFVPVGVHLCGHCGLYFKPAEAHLSDEAEEKRYLYHQNDLNDPSYLLFLERLLFPLKSFLPHEFTALDFGCGKAPVISVELQKRGGVVAFYDPLFYPDKESEVLNKKYDIVTCSEVVEHFKCPQDSWDILMNCVRPGGLLAVMTQFLNDPSQYHQWWYKNDPTHVVFYSEKVFHFIAKKYQLEIVYNDLKSVIIFRRKMTDNCEGVNNV